MSKTYPKSRTGYYNQWSEKKGDPVGKAGAIGAFLGGLFVALLFIAYMQVNNMQSIPKCAEDEILYNYRYISKDGEDIMKCVPIFDGWKD